MKKFSLLLALFVYVFCCSGDVIAGNNITEPASPVVEDDKLASVSNQTNGALSNPVLTGISGPERLWQGQSANYQTIPFTPNLPYMKYVWEVGYDEVGATSAPTFSYTFNEPGIIHIYCTMTNINTGMFASACKEVKVVEYRRSLMANEQFSILNLPGALLVTETESSETFSMVKTDRIVDYQLNGLLTGLTALKGKISIGGSIETGNIPKGVYLLTLKSDNHTETHKVVIK